MPMTLTKEEKKLLHDKAAILKALSHPVRLCIVMNLLESGGCNVTNMQNCLSMAQSTISQHLTKLKSSGIVEGNRTGTEIVYRVINPDAVKIVQSLEII